MRRRPELNNFHQVGGSIIKDRDGELAKFILERAPEQTPFERKRNVYELKMRVKAPKSTPTPKRKSPNQRTESKRAARNNQEPSPMELDAMQAWNLFPVDNEGFANMMSSAGGFPGRGFGP